jgi:Fe-S-cluster-containing hydrogenase component 2
MCEFCHKHGEGKKWYLQAKNYSEDLLSDLRRRKFIADFFLHPEDTAKEVAKLERLDRAPAFVRSVLTPYMSNRQKKVHFGQVLPIEDVEGIFGFVSSIVRVACLCRQITVGTEQRYCYAVSMAPQGGKFEQIIREIDAGYLTGPDTAGLETLSKDEALASLREHEKDGLCHTVWTFITPFIGGICNCDRSDCFAMRCTVTYRMPVMFRAEYVAEVNPELCNGCRQCMRVCQFGAIGYSAANKKVVIDPRRCYGCGVCRASCTKDAIALQDRSAVPVAAAIW